MKPIIFEEKVWDQEIWPGIVSEYGKKIAITWVCKRELGFTVRRHTEYQLQVEDRWSSYPRKNTKVHLDFYDEQMRTLFLLKYS